jgi:hypothetical protein
MKLDQTRPLSLQMKQESTNTDEAKLCARKQQSIIKDSYWRAKTDYLITADELFLTNRPSSSALNQVGNSELI